MVVHILEGAVVVVWEPQDLVDLVAAEMGIKQVRLLLLGKMVVVILEAEAEAKEVFQVETQQAAPVS